MLDFFAMNEKLIIDGLFTDDGVKPVSNLGRIEEDESFTDGVSRMSLQEGTAKNFDDYTFITMDTNDTGFKSYGTPMSAKKLDFRSVMSPMKSSKNARNLAFKYGNGHREYDYMVHVWDDMTPKK